MSEVYTVHELGISKGAFVEKSDGLPLLSEDDGVNCLIGRLADADCNASLDQYGQSSCRLRLSFCDDDKQEKYNLVVPIFGNDGMSLLNAISSADNFEPQVKIVLAIDKSGNYTRNTVSIRDTVLAWRANVPKKIQLPNTQWVDPPERTALIFSFLNIIRKKLGLPLRCCEQCPSPLCAESLRAEATTVAPSQE